MIAEETKANEQLEALRQHAKERLTALNNSIVDISKANDRLLKADETWECTGELDISAVLVHTSIRIRDMRFDTGEVLNFDATGWGIGLGATGKSPGAGIFNVPPSDLLRRDKVKVQVFFLVAGIGGVELTFWNEHANEYLGVFAAGSIGGGGGSFAADGKFSKA